MAGRSEAAQVILICIILAVWIALHLHRKAQRLARQRFELTVRLLTIIARQRFHGPLSGGNVIQLDRRRALTVSKDLLWRRSSANLDLQRKEAS